MKLTNHFGAAFAAAKTSATSKVSHNGKRKKEHLLLKPPPSPELRAVNDNDDDDSSQLQYEAGFKSPRLRQSSLANNKTSGVAMRQSQQNQLESTENLNSRYSNNKCPSQLEASQSKSARFASTIGTQSEASDGNVQNQRQHIKTKTSVIHHHHQTANNKRPSSSSPPPPSARRGSSSSCAHFDLNPEMRPQKLAEWTERPTPQSNLMMSSFREEAHHNHNNHYHHDRRQLQGHHQETQAESAARISRRKSELTSFLTILFGSMFALLLLTGNQMILCAQNGPQSGLVGANNSSSSTSSAPMTTPTSMESIEKDVTLEPSDSSSEETLPSVTSSSSSSPAPDGKTDDEDEENSGGQESPAKTRLGDLLADTARDATDLLINHLSKSNNDANKTGTESDNETEQPEENNSTVEDGTTKPPPGNTSITETGNGSTEEAVASPLAASNSSSKSTATPEDQIPLADKPEADGDAETRFALETYAKWRAAGDDIIELFSRKLMPIIIEHGYDVDSQTVGGLLQAFNGIRQLKPWALRLLDAWTKLSPGLLRGTQSDFGDFDECLSIRVDDPNGLAAGNSEHFLGNELDPLTGLPTTTLIGRYCLADVDFPKPPRKRASGNLSETTSPTWPYEPIELRTPLLDFAQLPAYKDTIFVETGNFLHMLHVDPVRVGICLTNKIDPLSFQQVFNKLLEEFRISINFRGRCVTKYDRPTWTRYQEVSAYVLLVACALVALSTALDLIQSKLNRLPCPRGWTSSRLRFQLAAMRHRDLITCFSLIRNTKRLFKPSADPRPAQTQPSQHHHQHHRTSIATANCHHHVVMASSGASSCTGASSVATTSSSIADSSVESSPAIERRSSSDTTTSSTKDLISLPARNSLPENRRQSIATMRTCCCEEPAAKDQANVAAAHVSLQCLHGIRVITMVWMIVNHTYMFGGFFVLWAHRRLIDIAEWPKSLSFQFVLNGWLTVETYFFLSAMIIVLNVLPLMRARKFNYFFYILHRLLRLLPAYIGLVCLNFLWPLISSGPVWLVKGKSFVQDPCEQYLWTNFLFINNWIWPEKQCMVHTWFLSADFQLYILAPVIVYLLYRRPALGHSLNLLVALLASILSGFVIYANKLMPATLINKLEFDAIKQQLSYSYFATYQHMGPYCLGLLVGYLLHKRPHARLPKHLTWLLWLLLPPLSFTTLLLTYLWNGAYPEANMINPSPVVSAVYVAIHRTIWSSLVAWLVFACSTGRAKLLASFLSNAIFLPISRLSYSIYLVHLPVIMFRAVNLRHTLEWSDQNILWEACGNFVVSSLLGFFLNVAFESPIINLENVIFGRRRSDESGAILFASHGSSKQAHGGGIFERSKLAALSTNHPDKPMSDQLGSAQTTTNASDHSYSSSSTSSDGCEESMMSSMAAGQHTDSASPTGTRPPAASQQTRKSLKPKESASVEQIFGRAKMHAQPPRAASNLDTGPSLRRKQQLNQQQQVANMAHEDDDQPDGAQTSAGSSLSDQSMATRATGGGQGTASAARRRTSGHQDNQLAQRSLAADNHDDLYSVAAEYRHYAPGSYQQWRRALGQLENYRQPAASSNSMRSMQYATLARSQRHRQPEPLVEVTNQFGRNQHQHATNHHQNRTEPYQQRFPVAPPSGYEDVHASHHDQLFPNSSELNFNQAALDDGRSTLIQQRQLLASRRRQGRYNTLTGTGSRDWRSQFQASHSNQMQHQMNEADLLRSWDQQQALWSSSGGVAGGVGHLGDGVLHIPRIDWSNTLRRQARKGGSTLSAASATAPASASNGGSLLGRQADQSDDSKIVEELSAEAEETSAL